LFGLSALLLYAATSWARCRGFGAIGASGAGASSSSLPWAKTASEAAASVAVGRAASAAFGALGPSLRRLVTQRLMPDEITRTLRRAVARCHAGPWFAAASSGALPRRGYEAGLVSLLRCWPHASAVFARALGAARLDATRARLVGLLGQGAECGQLLVRDLRMLAIDANAELATLGQHPGVTSIAALVQTLEVSDVGAATSLVVAAVLEALLAWPQSATLTALEPHAARWTGGAGTGVDFLRERLAKATTPAAALEPWAWLRAELAGRFSDELGLQRALAHATALVAAFSWTLRDAVGVDSAAASPVLASPAWH
jgi:hypothetical protein